MSQRERCSSALFCSPSSTQVAAMPCSRSAFNSVMTSRIGGPLLGGLVGPQLAQSVVARRVRHGLGQHAKRRGHVLRPRRRRQPRQHVAHVLRADPAAGPGALQRQFGRHQHGVQPGHLHQIQHLDSAADASWRNINAIDDVALAILQLTDRLVVATLRGNARAGGCFLALAADEVWAHGGVVLNPHYKNMGNLYGSEYWTYLLPRRVGGPARDGVCRRITQGRLPIGVREALELRLLVRCLAADAAGFDAASAAAAHALAASPDVGDCIAAKAARRAADEAAKPLAAYRAEELARMQGNFYGFDPSYHVARHHFVARKPQAWTSRHLAAHRLR